MGSPEVTSTATVHILTAVALEVSLLLNLQELASIPGPTVSAKKTCTKYAHQSRDCCP